MGAKRPFAEVDSPEAGNDGTKRRKTPGKSKHKAKQGTSEFSKKRARNIERLLRRKQDLPDDVVNELERERETHQTDLADRALQRKRSAMIAKYHMVRFFERRKASRLVKQLKRQAEQSPGPCEAEQLARDLHIAEVDEAYTRFFPHLEPYVSLYGSTQSAEADEGEGEGKTPSAKVSLRAERPPMWSVVEASLAEGPEALRMLRERRPADGKATGATPKRPRPKTPGHGPGAAPASNAPAAPPQKEQDKQERRSGKAGVPSATDSAAPRLNRRERRRLMHQAKAATDASDGEEGGGAFFDGL